MKKITIACSVLILACAVMSFAGFERTSSKTGWVPRPTDATCWARDSFGDVHPLKYVKVEDDTFTYLVGGISPTNSTNVGTGYWHKDADGDYSPIDCSGIYGQRLEITCKVDVEWKLDSDGDLCPKD